ncbi:MAG TPA: hypothetical protein VD993_15700 [Chitinophagaceae bacterium]|nr:hypothetical protein [Chitinophagaceae bacterium]
MRSRRRKHELNAEPATEPALPAGRSFFAKDKKTSNGSGSFFQQAPAVQKKLAETPKAGIQKKDDPDAGVAKDAGTAKQTEEKKDASTAAPAAFDIKTIRNEFISTIFAEAVSGQETDIAWIYYNLISQKGASGLTRSAAYNNKSDNFKIAMTALGDKTYLEDKLRDSWVKKSKVPEKTVGEYVDKNGYFTSNVAPRVASIAGIVDGIIAKPAGNPYPGWTGQGNLDDFNNISKPNSKYWKMARAYFWLQKAGAVTETYVKEIGKGENVQFIFNGKKIEDYYKVNKLPDTVPKYDPNAKTDTEAKPKPKP